MKTVSINKALNVSDNSVGSIGFKDSCKSLWRDKLPFNIFDSSGYLTEDAKDFIRTKNIEIKSNETAGEAILRYAEWNELGYQVDKSPKKRSDVRFSGSMILSNYMDKADYGDTYELSNDSGEFEEGIDLAEMASDASYAGYDGSYKAIKFRGVDIKVPKSTRTIVKNRK